MENKKSFSEKFLDHFHIAALPGEKINSINESNDIQLRVISGVSKAANRMPDVFSDAPSDFKNKEVQNAILARKKGKIIVGPFKAAGMVIKHRLGIKKIVFDDPTPSLPNPSDDELIV